MTAIARNFVKMEGLGNDFIVIEGPADIDPADVARWCERRHGVGADGVLEATPLGGDRVRMRYWNADGGVAEMCGNGLRCVARLAVERGWVDGPGMTIETPVGDRPAVVRSDGTVRVLLGTPHGHRVERLAVAGTSVQPVGLGNPHAIMFVDDLDKAPVSELGPRISTDPMFPAGTNVEFATLAGEDRISLRVWERGVGETLACGSGAAATAYLAYREGKVGARSIVELRGGELIVELDDDGAWIEGPTGIVFEGSVS